MQKENLYLDGKNVTKRLLFKGEKLIKGWKFSISILKDSEGKYFIEANCTEDSVNAFIELFGESLQKVKTWFTNSTNWLDYDLMLKCLQIHKQRLILVNPKYLKWILRVNKNQSN